MPLTRLSPASPHQGISHGYPANRPNLRVTVPSPKAASSSNSGETLKHSYPGDTLTPSNNTNTDLNGDQNPTQLISPLSKKFMYRTLINQHMGSPSSPSSHNSNISKSPSRGVNASSVRTPSSQNDTQSMASSFDMHSAKKRAWLTFVKKQKDDVKMKPEFEYLVHLEAENRDIVETMLDDKIQKQNASFFKFLWDRDGYDDKLADRFFSLNIIYISALVRLERMKLTCDMLATSTHEQMREKRQVKKQMQLQKRTAYDHLVQLSFTYSLILQRYRFEKDSAKEKQFFETLYTVVARLVCSRFENQSLHPIIETEVERLFRSEHFFMPKREKNDLQYFISTQDVHQLRSHHTQQVKLPLGTVKSGIAFSKRQSPLMSRVFPVDTAKVNEYIDQMHLHIPPENLLFDSQKRKKSGTKNLVSQLEEEAGEMNGQDATLMQLQLKALYELESTTRSAKNARELLEKSMF
mmetsp:Transcript_4228/g.15964  ORF Transcript_4228/g.15964 Transcript_4228/m.15964 type:complete len:466 (+) Transcript_4228:258-1655(+)